LKTIGSVDLPLEFSLDFEQLDSWHESWFCYSYQLHTMELLLNIIWLALALPAVWMRCHKPAYAHRSERFEGCRPFLLLGCALILLFPVVSATDDLNAMRPEMEESNPSTRQLKHSSAMKSCVSAHVTGSFLFNSVGFRADENDEPCGLISSVSARLPKDARLSKEFSRGPPASILS
jgi:hypothetical protein